MQGPRLGWLVVWGVAAAWVPTSGAPSCPSCHVTASQETTWSFSDDPAGEPPASVTLASLRQPSPGSWAVAHTRQGRFLRHKGDPDAHGWSMALMPADPLRDLQLSVRLRLTGGLRAGGLVWRYRDDNNFHAAMLNLTDHKISVYRVTDGNRIRLEMRDGLELDNAAWHTLRVIHDGPRVTVFIAGIRVLQDDDRRYAPELDGRVGVLASGSSDIDFDDVKMAVRVQGR